MENKVSEENFRKAEIILDPIVRGDDAIGGEKVRTFHRIVKVLQSRSEREEELRKEMAHYELKMAITEDSKKSLYDDFNEVVRQRDALKKQSEALAGALEKTKMYLEWNSPNSVAETKESGCYRDIETALKAYRKEQGK